MEFAMDKEVAIHFSGGKDSTYLTLQLLQKYDRIHLLTFTHGLVRNVEHVYVNYRKFQKIFHEKEIHLKIIDINELTRTLFETQWLKNLKKYKTWYSNQFCGFCRLAMFSSTVEYCMKNNINLVRDGSTQSGNDICQSSWAYELLAGFFNKYGIDYQWEIFNKTRCDVALLKYGLSLKNPVLLYGSQIDCQGGKIFHNFYLRRYFFPLYGQEKHRSFSLEWLKDRLELCRRILKNKGIEAKSQHSNFKSILNI